MPEKESAGAHYRRLLLFANYSPVFTRERERKATEIESIHAGSCGSINISADFSAGRLVNRLVFVLSQQPAQEIVLGSAYTRRQKQQIYLPPPPFLRFRLFFSLVYYLLPLLLSSSLVPHFFNRDNRPARFFFFFFRRVLSFKTNVPICDSVLIRGVITSALFNKLADENSRSGIHV